jgi:hypothetical protein
MTFGAAAVIGAATVGGSLIAANASGRAASKQADAAGKHLRNSLHKRWRRLAFSRIC